VISKKKKIIHYLDELGVFYRRKMGFHEKKNFRRSAVCRDFMATQMKIVSARFSKDAFKLETSRFGSLKVLV
jgi:hypothetical protein